MSNKNKLSNKITHTPVPQKKTVSKEARQTAYLLIANSAILLFLYFAAMGSGIVVIQKGVISQSPIMLGEIVCICYWLVFAAFFIAYIVYNRAFSRKGITEEMLPIDWSDEKKREYIDSGKERLAKSKWMLSVIIPLIVTIGADAIYLFTWPLIQGIFS